MCVHSLHLSGCIWSIPQYPAADHVGFHTTTTVSTAFAESVACFLAARGQPGVGQGGVGQGGVLPGGWTVLREPLKDK